MPLITFWFYASTLIRLMAENDMRSLTVANAASSGEGAEAVQKRLVIEMSGETPEEAQLAEVLDRDGLDDLRNEAMRF